MNDAPPSPADDSAIESGRLGRWFVGVEVLLLVTLFFVHSGDAPPAINEAHYLCKAKNYWDPTWCQNDLFVASGKAHVMFYLTIGSLTQFTSLSTTAWIGRLLGWTLIAIGLQRLSWRIAAVPMASVLVALVWIVGVEQADLAGEWVIGGTEAKVFAYGLVLFALDAMVQNRWRWVWPMLGAASAMHVLVGGWSVVAAGLTFAVIRPDRHVASRREFAIKQCASLALGGGIALLGLVPGLATMGKADAATASQAASIYVYERISHHLYPAVFGWDHFARHGLLILATGVLAWPVRRDRRLRCVLVFAMAAVSIAVAGLLLGMLPAWAPDLAARLLRYYWFRLTDAMVPLAAGLTLAVWCTDRCPSDGRRVVVGWVAALCIGLFAQMFLNRQHLSMPEACSQSLLALDASRTPEAKQQIYRDWLAVCDWARSNSRPEDVFLTPRNQQTFKWYAQRAEVVNWKDVPQDAQSLLEWKRRMQEVFPARLGGARVTIRYDLLSAMKKRYGAKYLVVDNRLATGNLPLVQLYPGDNDTNASFRVYQLP